MVAMLVACRPGNGVVAMTVAMRIALAALVASLPAMPGAGATAMDAEASGAADACPPAPYSRDELLALPGADFQPARGGDENAWIVRLLACAEDPDPAIRDGVVFEAWQRWLRSGRIEPGILPGLARTLMDRLAGPADSQGFRHPFAALLLSELARADRLQPFLEDAQRTELLELAARWLASIEDHRAWHPVEGWRHAVAHGADLALQLDCTRRSMPTACAACSTPWPARSRRRRTHSPTANRNGWRVPRCSCTAAAC